MQAQLLEVVRQIASQDFPDAWSNLLPEALSSLAGGQPARMYGSLQVLRKVASSLEFASPNTMQVWCEWHDIHNLYIQHRSQLHISSDVEHVDVMHI